LVLFCGEKVFRKKNEAKDKMETKTKRLLVVILIVFILLMAILIYKYKHLVPEITFEYHKGWQKTQ